MQTILGVMAGTVLAITVFPQAIRAWKVSTHGVSPTTYQLIVAVGGTWVAYGVTQGLWEVIVADSLYGLSSIVVLACCRRDGARWRDLVPVAVVTTAVAAALGATIGAVAIGWFAVTVAGVIRIPQIIDAVRSPDVAGVSVGTWWFGVLGNLFWFGYGILAEDARLYAGAAVAAVLSFLIIAIVEVRRRGRGGALALEGLAP